MSEDPENPRTRENGMTAGRAQSAGVCYRKVGLKQFVIGRGVAAMDESEHTQEGTQS
jgi:hypothetical protein